MTQTKPKTRRTRIYLSGPLTTGMLTFNVRKAMDAASVLLERGYAVYVPHANVLWEIVHPPSPDPKAAYDVWLGHDFEWVRACDVVLRLPGESHGGDAEVVFARQLGRRVEFSLETVLAGVPATLPEASPPGALDFPRDQRGDIRPRVNETEQSETTTRHTQGVKDADGSGSTRTGAAAVSDANSNTGSTAGGPGHEGAPSHYPTRSFVVYTREQQAVLNVFLQLLLSVTADGGKKRARGEKPPWWRDPSHPRAIISHLTKWGAKELKDKDSGAHPLVHMAWRALAIAYQETTGQVDPDQPCDGGRHPAQEFCTYLHTDEATLQNVEKRLAGRTDSYCDKHGFCDCAVCE